MVRRGARLVVRCPHLSKSYPFALFTTEFCGCLCSISQMELHFVSFRDCLDSRVKAQIFFLYLRERFPTHLGHLCLCLVVIALPFQTLPEFGSSFGVCQDGGKIGRVGLYYSGPQTSLLSPSTRVCGIVKMILNGVVFSLSRRLAHFWATSAFTVTTYLDFSTGSPDFALTYLSVSSAQQICCWSFSKANQIAILHLLYLTCNSLKPFPISDIH